MTCLTNLTLLSSQHGCKIPSKALRRRHRAADRGRAGQGGGKPSPAAIADSQAVAATHRSRTLAALFEEFRTTTPQNARINSRAISNLFFDGNPLMRLVSSGNFASLQASGRALTKFEASNDMIGGKGLFLCDHDRKWSLTVRQLLEPSGLQVTQTPFRTPNCNATRSGSSARSKKSA